MEAYLETTIREWGEVAWPGGLEIMKRGKKKKTKTFRCVRSVGKFAPEGREVLVREELGEKKTARGKVRRGRGHQGPKKKKGERGVFQMS